MLFYTVSAYISVPLRLVMRSEEMDYRQTVCDLGLQINFKELQFNDSSSDCLCSRFTHPPPPLPLPPLPPLPLLLPLPPPLPPSPLLPLPPPLPLIIFLLFLLLFFLLFLLLPSSHLPPIPLPP